MKPQKTVLLLWPCFRCSPMPHGSTIMRQHATIELLKGRLQFANRTDNGYSPFGHGIFVFRKQSARVDNQLAISLVGHRIGTSSPRYVAARAEPSENRGWRARSQQCDGA